MPCPSGFAFVTYERAIERFSSKYIACPMSGCWLWTAGMDRDGYGVFFLRGKYARAPRSSWELYRGDIPEGKWVLHHCDNRACVNPNHLYLGTICENTNDMLARGRQASGYRVHTAKLTSDQVREIRARILEGGVLKLMVADYCVSYSTLRRIKRMEIWQNM